MTHPSTIDALLPVKAFELSKERLGGLLSHAERSMLSRAMFADVIEALAACSSVRKTWVVSADQEVTVLTSQLGASPIAEEPGGYGLNAALEAGRRAIMAIADAPHCLLVVPADLPAASAFALEAFLDDPPLEPAVRLCPSPDNGTNALLLCPPGAIPFAYGRDSATVHAELARLRGIDVAIRRVAGLDFDLDNPDDLELGRLHALGSRTRAAFTRLQESRASATDR